MCTTHFHLVVLLKWKLVPNQQQDFCETTKIYDVPFVVYYFTNKATKFMIPIKVTCPSSWIRVDYEYFVIVKQSMNVSLLMLKLYHLEPEQVLKVLCSIW